MLQAEQILHERYQLKEPLNKNAGRQTWLAIDLSANPRELVIVKLLAFSPHLQWDDFKLFEREAQVLKHLQHPRIPRYRDYFSLDNVSGSGLSWFGLVQEHIPGASLQQILARGDRFNESQIRHIATSVLDILIYLHELSPPVLHRDIKPSNLILAEDKRVYLVDFGAVQDRAGVEGVTFTVVGTCGYAPLEQFWGRTVPASDLYALGATLIHLLTGRTPADLPQQNLRICFANNVSVSPGLVRWIEQLTEPALEQRFASARSALAALKSAQRYPQRAADIEPSYLAELSNSLANTSGQGFLSNGSVPAEILGWNWGAFLLAPFWSMSHRVWIGALSFGAFFIPPMGFFVAIMLGAMGNEWAWKTRRWNSIAEFKALQRAWTQMALLFFLALPATLLAVALLFALL
ncbi:serine/threonine protein kinase [Microcoleus sp. FACHB-831]|uniref:serine/threonine protein kinase n=1 Tax=Microcoleus sp. FACHB-831 TaxID=2692827 RepID=UPI0016851AB5|nr:serine/threonine-protein kinase [Microcoleus sp. FACHB-831]MBD1919846.1 serine/threonine protein kinase [Microcoleus sp. FACHB-831]